MRDEFRLPGKGVMAFERSAAVIFPGQNIKPLVDIFVEIATGFLDFKEAQRGWEELGERFEPRMKGATLTIRAMTAVSLGCVSESSGRLFLMAATHFDPLNFGAGEEAFIKKSLFGLRDVRDERRGRQQKQNGGGGKRQSHRCHFCHEEFSDSFSEHNKVCKKPKEQGPSEKKERYPQVKSAKKTS